MFARTAVHVNPLLIKEIQEEKLLYGHVSQSYAAN